MPELLGAVLIVVDALTDVAVVELSSSTPLGRFDVIITVDVARSELVAVVELLCCCVIGVVPEVLSVNVKVEALSTLSF